jgi:Cu(I)/Ag(I) efflux system membrane fusion protein
MKKFAMAIVVVAGVGGGYGLYQWGWQRGAASVPVAAAVAVPQSIAEGEAATRRHIASGIKAGDLDPAAGRKVLYYHDPMVPGNKFDAPAKSPFMDMMLVPVYADGATSAAAGDASTVTVSPRMQQNLGVRSVLVDASLQVPTEALIPTARRTVLVLAEADGHFRPVVVETGVEADGKTRVLRGLQAGQRVVVSGQFLIDSEASLKGVEARMLAGATP